MPADRAVDIAKLNGKHFFKSLLQSRFVIMGDAQAQPRQSGDWQADNKDQKNERSDAQDSFAIQMETRMSCRQFTRVAKGDVIDE